MKAGVKIHGNFFGRPLVQQLYMERNIKGLFFHLPCMKGRKGIKTVKCIHERRKK